MGYDPNFIANAEVPLPIPGTRVSNTGYRGNEYIHHTRYSLLFNEDRGFASCTAHNIDGSTLPDKQYTTRSFKFDPEIKPNGLQVDTDRGYSGVHNDWDQGHLTRRKSMSWGNATEARIAERESDHFSNIAPQHETLHDDAWGSIEDWMLERVEGGNSRACVFQGPVFTDDDPVHKNGPKEVQIQIPAGYWKVMTVELNGKLRAAGFLLWQRDYDNDKPLPFAPILEQVRLTTIEVLTGFSFPALRNFDPLLYDANDNLKMASNRRFSQEEGAIVWNELQTASKGSLPKYEDSILASAVQPTTSRILDKYDILL